MNFISDGFIYWPIISIVIKKYIDMTGSYQPPLVFRVELNQQGESADSLYSHALSTPN